MSRENEDKTAVVLSGGGAYGAYEVGVLKALLGGEMKGTGYRPIEPQIYTGTSVGAFNASVLAAQPDVSHAAAAARLERNWLEEISDGGRGCGNGVFRFRANPFRYLDPDCFANLSDPVEDFGDDAGFLARSFLSRSLNFLTTGGRFANRALQFIDLSAFITVDPFREMLVRTINPEAINNSDKDLRIVATNWETGEVKVFENRHVAHELFGPQMIMASAAIPGIFPPVEIDGVPYVDGGAVMNTPLKCAIKAGAKTLFVVYLDPDVGNIPLQRLMNTIDTMDRVYTIMLATKMNEDIDTAAWINDGLAVMEKVRSAGSADELSGAEITSFTRVAAQIAERARAGRQYTKLTIHRFHPHDDLGGPLGMLDFSRQAVTNLIARGFEDAIYHDCEESHCIIPDAPPPRPKYMGTSWTQTTL